MGTHRLQSSGKVNLLPASNDRTRFLSVEEAGKLLEAASRHPRPILILALETGMRRGEILSLRWSDVDMINGMLYIGKTKNNEARHVPMSNRVRATLSAIPRRLRSDYVFTRSIRKTQRGKGRKHPLNQPIGKVGKPFNDFRTSFENACMKAGITGFRFHDLRHTAASHMVMARVPFRTVGEILGHKTTTMTERYSLLTPEHKRMAVESLPNWEASEKSNDKVVTNEG
jgi:integrase